jgi:hypothetical protein
MLQHPASNAKTFSALVRYEIAAERGTMGWPANQKAGKT